MHGLKKGGDPEICVVTSQDQLQGLVPWTRFVVVHLQCCALRPIVGQSGDLTN